jgi:blue light- and temperature-responsive anti-repressor
MASLMHLTYGSAATRPFSNDELIELLKRARANNAHLGVTGMLVYENGSFFQVLEGSESAVEKIFQTITQDPRHHKIVTIIREPIPKRSFGEWTMGYSSVTVRELDEIVGANDFFTTGSSFTGVSPGRAKKLLDAFRQGRWRSRVRYTLPVDKAEMPETVVGQVALSPVPNVSFAFQPIIDARGETLAGYEAFFRGPQNESLRDILPRISEKEWICFDTTGRAKAIDLAVKLGIGCNLHLNFMARHLDDARAAIRSTLEAANRHQFEPSQLVLEIDQDRLIGEPEQIGKIIEEYRGAGLRISIDHFGAGRAGLNLLEPLRPEMISLNSDLVRGIAGNGSRQAIVRGVLQTCNDLGIDMIAKHVETPQDYRWFVEEGVHLIQGNLIARAAFEELPAPIFPR